MLRAEGMRAHCLRIERGGPAIQIGAQIEVLPPTDRSYEEVEQLFDDRALHLGYDIYGVCVCAAHRKV